jgi:D-galactarolactone isomerase
LLEAVVAHPNPQVHPHDTAARQSAVDARRTFVKPWTNHGHQDEALMKVSDFPNAWDCHFHALDEGFPASSGETPNLIANVSEYREMARQIGFARGVVVQPYLKGTDNRSTLDALAVLGCRYRGVVIIDEPVDIRTLRRWHSRGIRGVRFDLTKGSETAAMIPELAKHVACLGWHVQLHTPAQGLIASERMLRALHVPLVLDHLTICDPEAEACVQRLLRAGKAWVKLSNPHHLRGAQRSSFEEMVNMGRRLVTVRPDRILFGSYWPYVEERVRPSSEELCDFVFACAQVPAIMHLILSENPAKLYGFGNDSHIRW